MDNKEKAIQIRCLPEYKERIRKAAKSLNMTISGFVVMLINEALKELEE